MEKVDGVTADEEEIGDNAISRTMDSTRMPLHDLTHDTGGLVGFELLPTSLQKTLVPLYYCIKPDYTC